jgi:putative Mg2+ transporter-C (MgtC) family protein
VVLQIVTGIGFLGGGAIVRYGATTRGLTTAASLWVTAAVGLAVGLEAWLAATLTTGIALLVLYAIRRLERKRGESLATLGERLRALPGVAGVDLAP